MLREAPDDYISMEIEQFGIFESRYFYCEDDCSTQLNQMIVILSLSDIKERRNRKIILAPLFDTIISWKKWQVFN